MKLSQEEINRSLSLAEAREKHPEFAKKVEATKMLVRDAASRDKNRTQAEIEAVVAEAVETLLMQELRTNNHI